MLSHNPHDGDCLGPSYQVAEKGMDSQKAVVVVFFHQFLAWEIQLDEPQVLEGVAGDCFLAHR